LLFDLGGVVIGLDFDRVFRLWAEKANCGVDQIRERFRQDEAYERHERGELAAGGYFSALRETLGIALSDADFLLGWNDIYCDPIEGMELLLRAASHRFPMFAFTNSNPSHQAIWSERLRRELSFFQEVFVSSELGLRKPDTRAFSAVAERTGYRPSQFLFFDDSPENVAGAENAGMQAVLARDVRDVRDALAVLGVEGS
jgi:putative hydrolase of the HAD superfamily